jgi:hypothetical protein
MMILIAGLVIRRRDMLELPADKIPASSAATATMFAWTKLRASTGLATTPDAVPVPPLNSWQMARSHPNIAFGDASIRGIFELPPVAHKCFVR